MKNILYSIFIATIILFSACNDENIPNADFNTYEASSLKATVGDEEITLNWEAVENTNPKGYYLSWVVTKTNIEAGTLEVEADIKTTTITKLVNGVEYAFSVQPVYANGRRGGKVTVKSSPVSSKISATNLAAAAGDQMVRLRWKKPANENYTGYKLLVSSMDDPITIDKNLESYTVTGLTNDTEYEFTLITVYPTGTSDAAQIKATPGSVFPIIVANTNFIQSHSYKFEYNEFYFSMGTVKSVSWNFGDGSTSAEKEPEHAFAALGDYTVVATVTYEDGTTDSGSIVIKVNGYEKEIGFGGLFGNVKVSNPVFSPDGKTYYVPTSSPAGHLFAFDVATGNAKWVYQISAATYGGGALVGTDGTIYVCGEKNKTVYAVNPDGTGKWTSTVDGDIGAFPALSTDGTLYCATDKGTLYAVNAATGAAKWNKAMDVTTRAGALAVDASNNVYAGTDKAVYKFNASGTELWKTSGIVNVTERGSFAMDASGTVLYAARKGGDGLSAIDMATGSIKWSYPNGSAGSDAYFPIVGSDGTIYFNEKGGKQRGYIYAINSDGSLKWSKNIGSPLTYCGLVLSDNGKIYSATQGKPEGINFYTLYGMNAATGEIEYTYQNPNQFMSAATIGPDRILYIGTIGTVIGAVNNNKGLMLALPIDAGPETSSWSVRGGNIYGTNRK